jgi:hypothetical protein
LRIDLRLDVLCLEDQQRGCSHRSVMEQVKNSLRRTSLGDCSFSQGTQH